MTVTITAADIQPLVRADDSVLELANLGVLHRRLYGDLVED